MKRIVLSAAVVFAAIFTATDANAQNQFPPMFSNQTHSAEAQPFADLSQQMVDDCHGIHHAHSRTGH